MNTRQRLLLALGVLFSGLVLCHTDARCASTELTFGLGTSLYSGTDAGSVTVPYTFDLTFSANYVGKKTLNLTNHFTFQALLLGKAFGNKYGRYNGIAGHYGPGLRLNFSKESVIPYIEGGPLIAEYAFRLQASSATVSQNQTCLMWGYHVGTGFDWLPQGAKRGENSGFGLAVSYFNGLPVFPFPAAALAANWIKLEFRWTLAPIEEAQSIGARRKRD